MTIVIPFPTKPYVKITCRLVAETRHVSARGVHVVRNPKPIRTYFLELYDGEGCACVWDGDNHADALTTANDWAVEGIPVRDHTDDWGHA